MVSPIGVCAEKCTGYKSLHVHVHVTNMQGLIKFINSRFI